MNKRFNKNRMSKTVNAMFKLWVKYQENTYKTIVVYTFWPEMVA